MNSFNGRYEDYWKGVNLQQSDSQFIARLDATAEMVKSLDRKNRSRLLDVGCGEGFLTQLLVQYTEHAVVFDISNTPVKHVRNTLLASNARIDYLIADCQRMPFTDNVFDVAVACEIIEHILYPGELLMELHRVIRRGGVLIISTPNRKRLGRKLTKFLRMRQNSDWHLREYTLSEITKELHRSGFRILEVKTDYLSFALPLNYSGKVFYIGSKKLSKHFPDLSTCYIIKSRNNP